MSDSLVIQESDVSRKIPSRNFVTVAKRIFCLFDRSRSKQGSYSSLSGDSERGWLSGLFLGGNLLLDVSPRADLQSAANPAKLFGRARCGFSSADGALDGRFRAVHCKCALRTFDDLWSDHRFGPGLRFPFHSYFHYVTPSADRKLRSYLPVPHLRYTSPL